MNSPPEVIVPADAEYETVLPFPVPEVTEIVAVPPVTTEASEDVIARG